MSETGAMVALGAESSPLQTWRKIEHDCGVDSLAFLYEVHDGSVLVRPEHQVHHVLPHFLSLLAPLRLGVHQSQQVRMPKHSHNLNFFFRQHVVSRSVAKVRA